MANDFLFKDEVETTDVIHSDKWKVVIVDDEPEIHAVTKLALNDFVFQHKGLEFISAYSGDEAKRCIREHDDIAVVLLDVVMETDDAGLKVAKYIRDEVKDQFVRIILRTGQAGQSPERDVIVNYDINDYKSKTELTAQKLFTAMMSSLRSYRDIKTIEQNRLGLEKVIDASVDIFSTAQHEPFYINVMRHISSIVAGKEEGTNPSVLVAACDTSTQHEDMVIFAGQGEFARAEGKRVKDVLGSQMRLAFNTAMINRELVFGEDFVVAYSSSQRASGGLLFVSEITYPLTDMQKDLIAILTNNIHIAFDNLLLKKEIEETQAEIAIRLTEALQKRHDDSSKHGVRVSEMCELLALKVGFDRAEALRIRLAAPLHDIGKLAIAEAILQQANDIAAQDEEQILQHTVLGYDILKGSQRPIIQAAAIMARDHHEWWDGSGFPQRKRGKDIHPFGRIIALADAYDTLRSQRCYKEPWPLERVIDFISQQKGSHFEPKLVDILLANIDEFESILVRHQD